MSLDLSQYERIQKGREEKKTGFSFSSKKLSDKKKEILYRELGLLLRSGVDFRKSLEILGHQADSTLEKKVIEDIRLKVVHGKPIYEAMRSSGQFSPYEYYSVQIGEETRKLEQVLTELQKFFTRRIQMKRQVISVLTYPSIVLAVTFGVLYFMLHKVVPMFSTVFRQFGSELPKSTRIILSLSQHSGLIFGTFGAVIIALVVAHYSLRNQENYRRMTASAVLRIPFFGKLIRKIYLSRFCQSMNLLLSSRTTLLNSLTLTSKMIGFYPVEKSIEAVKADITKGATLSEGLRKHAVYENRMVAMIEVAEQVNELDTMFERLSEQYNDDINHQTKMIGVVLEPMIIIFIGVIVGVIMISMYAPMFDLSKIIHR
ncbi:MULTISPECIES: type II secretion system F family protein [unclassified Flavobacterium]|uniref:type II secretion system F family protein n=1 Tax=unclassified Flavobacterium TaxID=196869 RepID=UPI001F13B9F2|nr:MULTISPECIES: type II secretion system F family protein [unclassified Flavobacterium]UMY66257.1 type II secretion system F family protein [Flavobacterium sp. HJ-32-4]